MPLADAYAQYGRAAVDRLRKEGKLTDATWEGDLAVYLLRDELVRAFEQPRLTRGGQDVG